MAQNRKRHLDNGAPRSEKNSFKEMSEVLQQSCADIVKHANGLPKLGDGFEYYSSFPTFQEFMNQQRLRLLQMLAKLLNNCAVRLILRDGVLEEMDKVIHANDFLIEKIAILIDEHYRNSEQRVKVPRLIPNAEPVSSSIKTASELTRNLASKQRPFPHRFSRINNAKTQVISPLVVTKPQTSFRDCIINDDIPFMHKLKFKHNSFDSTVSKINGSVSVTADTTALLSVSFDWINFDDQSQQHPYQFEIECFKHSAALFDPPKLILSSPELDDTKLIIIQDSEHLDLLVGELMNVNEFSFDIEHHDLRSYLGLTCLVQISTRNCDYIVDPFPIWRHMYKLNEVFSNPKILKVAHSADSDVLWLQRDFGIYVLNLFDTKFAMRLLNFSKLSLKYLVEVVCGFSLDKSFQRADWRRRPLPPDFLKYARQDTHYLLQCYDHLKLELSKIPSSDDDLSNIQRAFLYSHKLSSLLYEQPRFHKKGYLKLLCSHRRFNNRQLHALEHLWEWRDRIARKLDESLEYVLPDHMMIQIAEVLPKEAPGILACCSPIPPILKNELNEIYKMIRTSRDIPLEKTLKDKVPEVERDASDVLTDPTIAANKITKIKAKLEYKIDFSAGKADDDHHSSLNIPAFSLNEKIFSNTSTTNVNSETSQIQNSALDSTTSLHTQIKNPNKRKFDEIFSSLNEWVTPYECYLVALKTLNKEEKGIGDVKPDISQIDTTPRYSHLEDNAETDKTVTEKIPSINNSKNKNNDSRLSVTVESLNETMKQFSKKAQENGVDDEDEDDAYLSHLYGYRDEYRDPPHLLNDSPFSDIDVLTKKARKRFRRAARKSADISLS